MLRMHNIGPAFLLVLFISQSVLAVPGDTVKSFPSPYSCPQGLAYDGEYLWNVDRKSDMIYKIDPNSFAPRNDIMKAHLQKQEYIPAENLKRGASRRMEAHYGEYSF